MAQSFEHLLTTSLSFDSILKYYGANIESINPLDEGPFLDYVFLNTKFKKLPVSEQLRILNLLNILKVRYSDEMYIQALDYDILVQRYILDNFPRNFTKSNKRYMEDNQTY